MKKNRMMRLASLLLVLVLMTSSVVGGTFAKYTTSASSADTARVAYWGFQSTNTMDITGLFKNVYDETVSATVDVIAPGTSGSAQFAFAYDEANGNAPEVDYTFKVETTGSNCAESIQNNASIQWKLDSGEYGNWTSLISAIEALDGDESYDAGELPEAFSTVDNVHTVYWRWVFTTGVESDTTDTTMGNAAELANVKLAIKITATQVD